jgi:hypothetical protein
MKRTLLLPVAIATACAAAPPDHAASAPAPDPAPTASAAIAPPPPELDALAALAERFAKTERGGCADRCCVGDLPEWYTAFRDTSDVPRAPLRRVIDETKDPRVRALALRWLGRGSDPDDLEVMARFADAGAVAGPTVSFFPAGQAAQACPPVAWQRPTLGEVAREAAGAIAGVRFETAAAFAEWRAAHPRPADDFDYWRPRPERIYELGRRNPELFVRVATMADVTHKDLRAEDVVREAKQAIGPLRLLAALEGEGAWPEQRDPERLRRFRWFVLAHGHELFDAAHLATLKRLWTAHPYSDDALHAALALTVARLDPGERRRVLVATLGQVSYASSGLVRELVASFFDEELALLKRRMGDPRTEHAQTQDRVAMLDQLRAEGRASLPKARKLLAGATRAGLESIEVTEALASWARALDPTLQLPPQDELRPRLLKGTSPADAQRLEAKAAGARKDCVDRVLRWLQTAR